MNINYILSETTNSATSASLREVVKRAEKDLFSNVIVIVPEPKSIAIERELLDISKNGAFSNIFVYSFMRLLHRIGGVSEQEVVSRQTCVMILRKIIMENMSKLLCYKKSAKTIGFAEKMYETIAQFKASSITVSEINEIVKNSSGALKSKMQDIALLFELYESALGETLLDDCDKLRRLGLLAKESDFIQNADVFVVGFDNVTNDMIDVLKEFAIHSKSITFSSVYFNENRKDKYIQNNELYKKLASIAEKLKYPYIPKFVKSNYSGDFWNIQNYLYSTEQKSVKYNGNVEIFELENKSHEINYLASQILNEIKKGKRFRDIAVVDAELENDIELLSKTFEEYEIPYFITRPYSTVDHFFINFIKLSVELINSNFSAEKVLRWVASPLLGLDGYSDFENYVKEFGVNYSGFFIKPTETQIENEEKRNKIISFLDSLTKIQKLFNLKDLKTCSVRSYIEKINLLIYEINAQENLQKIALKEKESGFFVESQVTESIFDKFVKINENLSKFLGDQVLDVNEFLQIYLSGFSEEDVNLIPVSVDCVLIQKKADGLYKIKDLFIIGANDGVFPIKMSDTGILQDVELECVSDIASKSVEPTIKAINKREKFLQFELMLIPSEKLFISYSVKKAGGANKAANVISRLVNLFGIKIKNNYALNEYVTKKTSENQFAKKIGSYLDGDNLSVNDLNVEYNKLRTTLSKHFKEYIENLSFGEKDFSIAEAKEIYFLNNKTSVSQLERYFACPYSFFARYGLRLKENKNARLSSLDIGTIIHRYVEIFIKRIKEFDDLSKKEFNDKAKIILEKTLEESKINTRKNLALLRFLESEILRLSKYLYEEQQYSSFKNDSRLNEFEFFGNNAVKLQVDENTVVSIEGKIDRIDKFGDYIRIIDYKTGDIDNSLASIYFGKKIQLVSYLSASEKINGKKVAGLFFLPIHSDFVKIQNKKANNYKMQGFLLDNIDVVKYMDSNLSLENNESSFVPLKIKNNKELRETGEFQISYGRTKTFLSEKEFNDAKKYVESLCTLAINEILDGNIEPSPIAKLNDRESVECSYCELAGFCQKNRAKFGLGRRCGGNISSDSFDLNKEDGNGD